MPHQDLLVNGAEMLGHAYLNTAAEGLLLRSCAEAVQKYLIDKSTGEPGRVAMWAAHETARERSGALMGVAPAQIALVSSTTEALNTIANGIDWRAGDEVVFTAVEFPSNMAPWVALAKRGVVCRIVHPREGLIRLDDLMEQINPRTRLVTLSQVSYATGQHLDPGPVWDRVKGSETLLCVDATQAAGRVPVRGNQADFAIASAFKWLNSIHGAAILTVSQRVIDRGVVGPAGWLSAESIYAPDRLERFRPRGDAGRFHAGMPNFDSIYALAAALEFHTPDRVAARRAELEPLVKRLWEGLQKLHLPLLTPADARDRAGIVAFRSSRAIELKHRLAESGIHVHADDGRVRAAVHWYTREGHVDRYVQALSELND